MAHKVLLVVSLAAGLCGCAGRLLPMTPVDVVALQQARAGKAALSKMWAGFPGVMLLAEDLLEHEIEQSTGQWTLYRVRIRRYLVLDAEDEEMTTFKFTTGKDWVLRKADLVVLPPDGEPRRYGLEKLVKQAKDKHKTVYKLAYPAVTSGTIIAERTEEQHIDQAKDPDVGHTLWINLPLPCLKRRVAYVHPSNWVVLTKRIGPDRRVGWKARPASGSRRIISVEQADVPPLPDEPFSSYNREDGTYLGLTVNHFQVNYLSYYGATSWKKLAAKFRKYVIDNDAVFSGSVGELTRKLVSGISDPEKRVTAIASYVQRNIKKDEEYEKKDFADVLKTGRGSPSQITGLTHLMIKKAGLQSRYVLIHSARRGHFDKRYLSWNTFDLPAVSVRLGQRERFILPFIKNLPMDLLPAFAQGRKAMRIGKEGFDGFFTTPVLEAGDSRVNELYRVRVDPKGLLQVKEQRTFHGHAAFNKRRELEDLKEDELQKKLKEDLTYTDGQVKLESARVVNREDPHKPLEILYVYTIENLLTLAGDEAVLQTAGLLAPTSRAKKVLQSKRRVRPIRIYGDISFTRKVELVLPAGWSPETRLQDASLKNRYGEVQVRYDTKSAGLVKAEQVLRLRRSKGPASEVKKLEELLGKGKGLQVPSIVFRISKP